MKTLSKLLFILTPRERKLAFLLLGMILVMAILASVFFFLVDLLLSNIVEFILGLGA